MQDVWKWFLRLFLDGERTDYIQCIFCQDVLRHLPSTNISLLKNHQCNNQTSLNDSHDVQFLTSKNRNTEILSVDGYIFHRYHMRFDGSCHWRCSKRGANCSVTALTKGDKLVALNSEHTHTPDSNVQNKFKKVVSPTKSKKNAAKRKPPKFPHRKQRSQKESELVALLKILAEEEHRISRQEEQSNKYPEVWRVFCRIFLGI